MKLLKIFQNTFIYLLEEQYVAVLYNEGIITLKTLLFSAYMYPLLLMA